MTSNTNTKKAVIVTGAGQGIGKATALLFASKGYFVFLAGRNEEKLIQVAEQCPHGASLLKIDLTKPASLEKYGKHLSERPDVCIEALINNAGTFERHDFLQAGMQPWRDQFEVHVFGTIQWTQLVLPLFLKQKKGSIVNVSSTLGLKPTADTSAYSAAKAAMISYTQSLALAYGPAGLRCNVVCPGIVDTPIHSFHQLPAEEKKQVLQSLQGLQPLQRIGTADEIAKAIYFLATDDSSWTTGSVLSVDGGINLT